MQSRAQIMDAYLFVGLLLAFVWSSSAQSLRTKEHCEGPSIPLNLTAVSGYWYEFSRLPKGMDIKCLSVLVPPTADTELKLILKYKITEDGKDRAIKETVSFPWDEATKNSIFVMKYGSASVTFKVLALFPTEVVFICSSQPAIKILTRDNDPKQADLNEFKTNFASMLGNVEMFYPDMTPKLCNAAVRPSTETAAILAILTLLSYLFQRNCCLLSIIYFYFYTD
ncbi:uncharacterized protein Dvir_GJ26594 [Drosophila virilis]|uniref:Lipocalin/cytosolic fatty-acid binding domain-containing protein n=1 Tax=Drosophila virilis TaxID=7244 RepID=A0A0Q9WB87_DROVI|nr:uncharacterized protein LOC26531364 [Drosophila virilis]KRF81913.1 uncharacterized protein Dvir_GJ26594 [Drosophila virilis]